MYLKLLRYIEALFKRKKKEKTHNKAIDISIFLNSEKM